MSLFRADLGGHGDEPRALPQRAGASLVTVIGVATVVAVMVSLLGIGAGLHADGRSTTISRTAPSCFPAGAPPIYMGSITRADVAHHRRRAGRQARPDGKPMVQPLATVIVEVANKTGGGDQHRPVPRHAATSAAR